ncbi:2-amino-4-hydroxy-6-hydroxymethyldihydropteridine diphosphokinase [Thermodesulfovibrionales bacterium]|nr:2-amino-4-hydroxy-6-hydroxymethyldihydropteridine diphosphokinase [Thermodesulfovibrionales bacterium]MCL0049835.1 2-amino-4-hydroxy-6-hydroxymethyldihydropteridine diphosphokinase [Thermodesulfovibrionales bacterium]MCL0083773.1 2-amino-4-hydroxy-6-hydroxymethyldihydropteridine diphosphokinase [Thermodesulfovibrionales bacterium]
MPTIYIGIGSNIGSREANCIKAVEILREKGIIIKKASSMYETEPWGLKDQPKFINMAIETETELSPEWLLVVTQEAEREMGRQSIAKWGPRVIDLDILFYGDMIVEMERLKIPHPLLCERDFVILPLSEISPDKVHPVSKKSISQIAAIKKPTSAFSTQKGMKMSLRARRAWQSR